MLDAYTARKAVPRIVLAVIGVNLSIYLCIAAVDITTVIGRGLGDLLTTPFVRADSYNFGIQGGLNGSSIVTNATAIVGGVGIFVGAGGLAAVIGGLATLAAAPLATLGMLLILAIPLMLVALAILITIIIRQALLIFLIIISPVAIACYVLPGTEKYFKQWLDLFTKTLLVYPIIVAIFAMSDVFGSIIFNSATTGSGLTAVVKIITGILVIYAPLFLIPFAFRFAGGVMGRLASVATTGAGKVAQMGPVKGRRDIAKREMQNRMVQNRATQADQLKSFASTRGNTRRGRIVAGLARKTAGSIGGYNIEEQASALRAQTAKILNDQIATGRDEEIRGLTANMQTARRDFTTQPQVVSTDDQGRTVTTSANGLMRVNGDGTTQFKSLGGTWVDESHVVAGQKRWGNDQYAQQAALSYEMRKAATDEEVAGISSRYADIATRPGGWGMNAGEAQGAFTGAGFENQNQHLEFKHTNAMTGDINYAGLAKEAYEKKGSYPLSQMSAHTIEMLAEAHRNGDANTRRQVEAVAETFMSRFGGGGGVQLDGEGEPVAASAATGGRSGGGPSYQANSQGSAHTAQAVRRLAVLTGAYRPQDPSTDTHSSVPPPDIPRLN